MPWTCLPGEPPNVNWCNGAGGAGLYKNPPEAWRGARTRGEPLTSCLYSLGCLLRRSAAIVFLLTLNATGNVRLFWCKTGLPYNSIEILVLGNITNTGSKPVNLKGGWMIIPFSMGVQTQYEGIWKRQTNPTDYFKIFCW